jgi:hypothetical protein
MVDFEGYSEGAMMDDRDEVTQFELETLASADGGEDTGVVAYETGGGRRRYRRWNIRGGLSGWIDAAHEAAFVNISLGGALIEHANMIRPGSTAFLTVAFQGQEAGLKCRVVRSEVYRYGVRPTQERHLIYRSGLEFVDTPEASLRVIDKTIESLKDAA